MRTLMPFDTEKERKPVKVYEWSVSWRQATYLGGGSLLFLQVCQWVYTDSVNFLINILFWVMCIPILIPFFVFALMKNSKTGHFYDRYLFYKIQHKRKQSGVWRMK
ncbi:PrgI family mobile element protein [Paenibacillus thiaminolyticus]|uniref:PrgI family protein n=1 Tax=Paenibacillus thiaminolyticus TaxID=49283 RepID=A0A3A3GCX6_PANTH|nr:hypothetical protein DQX05_21725 [Paenibacillus thiaminolyticus]